MNKQQEFTQKLAKLLEDYQAYISFECSPGSDLHGVYKPHIVATIDNGDFTLAYGYTCFADDIAGETNSDDEE